MLPKGSSATTRVDGAHRDNRQLRRSVPEMDKARAMSFRSAAVFCANLAWEYVLKKKKGATVTARPASSLSTAIRGKGVPH